MKKALLLIIFFPFFANAQITTRSITKTPEKEIVLPKYDSTRNFLGENVNLYIGQELYTNGINKLIQDLGYDGFYLNHDNTSSIYKPAKTGKESSEYNALYGKYFTVIDVVNPSKSMFRNNLLKLISRETRDTVYYKYDKEHEFLFPFIIVGYFEKLKRENIGKKMVFTSRSLNSYTDINGNPIKHRVGEIWSCTDVIIEDANYKITLLLKNTAGNEIAILDKNISSMKYWPSSEALKYKTKFGAGNWNTILTEKVNVGMNKEMCLISWGEPENINKTITAGNTSEQWVYADNYLYFENGKLTAIQ